MLFLWLSVPRAFPPFPYTTLFRSRDVIVSGGDPLTLPIGKLRYYLDNLKAIPHVDVIRVGTRVPVTLPQRLYDPEDRKSTRLNSSHVSISYAVFCLKKKKKE